MTPYRPDSIESPSLRAMRRNASTWLSSTVLAICAGLAPVIASAQFEADRSGFVGSPEIYMPGEIESAHAAGMGRVTSVLPDGAVATWWNPGFLASDKTWGLSLSTADISFWRESDPGYIWSATLSGPLPFGPRGVAAGLGFKRLAFEFEAFTPFGDNDLFELTQDAYVLALACPVSSSFAIGASAEYVRDDLDGEVADAASLGLGVAFRRPIVFEPTRGGDDSLGGDRRLVLTPLAGASFLHVGQDLDFAGVSSELARQLRGGIGLGVALEPPPETPAFDRRRWSQLDLTTALEVYFPAVEAEQISQKRAIVHMGAELMLFGMLSSRVGFIDIDSRQGIGPPYGRRDETFGFGVSLPPGMPMIARVDWASVPSLFDERIDRWSVEIGLPRDRQSPHP
jgi:hypothetical protein